MKRLATSILLLTAPAIDQFLSNPLRATFLGLPHFLLFPLDVPFLISSLRRRPVRSLAFLAVAVATLAIPGTTTLLAPIERLTR